MKNSALCDDVNLFWSEEEKKETRFASLVIEMDIAYF